MVGIDISKLGVEELRRLSDVARTRGQTALMDALARELRNRLQPATPAPVPAPATLTAPPVPPLSRPITPPRRRSGWATAAAALALVLAGGTTVPRAAIVGWETPQLTLIGVPIPGALCAAFASIGGDEGCQVLVPWIEGPGAVGPAT